MNPLFGVGITFTTLACSSAFTYICVCVCDVLQKVLYSLRLFVVGGERIAMAMAVVGHICTQSIMVVHNVPMHSYSSLSPSCR